MTPYEAKQAIREQVDFYVRKAEQEFGIRIARPEIDFSLKGRTAGTARASVTPKLRFNLTALQVEGGWSHLINNTVPHEVAHLVQYLHPSWPKDRRSNTPHGAYWRLVMSKFGVKADRCHSLPLPKARQTKTAVAYCACGQIELGVIRARKIAMKKASYKCKKCYSLIKLA